MTKRHRNRRRHPEAEEGSGDERWLVSYADLITLLFAFFVVMYATSQQDLLKAKQFEDSINEKLSTVDLTQVLSGGTATEQAEQVVKVVEANESNQQARTLSGVTHVKEQAPEGAAELKDYLERKLGARLGTVKKDETVLSLRSDAVGVRMSLAASALFPSGEAEFRPESIKTLHRIGEILSTASQTIIVEGHSDNVPLSSGARYPSNWELSAARATAFIRYLMETHGITPNRLIAMSFADQRPLVSNKTEESRAKNRRIEVFIVTDPKALPAR